MNDTRAAWKEYHEQGIVSSDTMLIAMLQEVINTIHSLDAMYPNGQASLVVYGMMPTYQSLTSMAFHRRIDNYPTLVRQE